MQVEVAAIVDRMQGAGRNWESALDAHVLAPPDAGFPVRLRALSAAAAEQAAAFALAAQGGLGWRARTIEGEFSLAPELTPGMNRPGPDELWERFDQAVRGLGAALSGSSLASLAAAFAELSEVAGLLAADLQRSYRPARVAR
jgi:hypothetical protein